MKQFFMVSGLVALMAPVSMAGVGKADHDFSNFEHRLQSPVRVSEERVGVVPVDPTIALKEVAVRPSSRFVGWNNGQTELPRFNAAGEEEGESLSSIECRFLNGALRSKQEFEYTETGLPLLSRNYLPSADGASFQLSGHYSYEYDKANRIIASENVNLNDPYSNVRYEFIYGSDSPQYTSKVMYLGDANGDWIPYERADYEFDNQGNTTKETYLIWSEEAYDWTFYMKQEASYDEIGRMVSYFPYSWDEQTAQWIGYSGPDGRAQSFQYTQSGKDALVSEYMWENDAWLEYYRIVSTYNDSDLEIQKDRLYWNRGKQDWSGADAYGMWGNMYYNSRQLNTYDEYGRLTMTDVANDNNGEYVYYYRETHEYGLLENGETSITEYRGSLNSDGEFAPHSKSVQHINKFGSETYYISYTKDSKGELVPQQEEIRYMDEYNWFLGGDYYNFFNGERKPSSKERFIYPDDFNPLLPYETPIEGQHWVGNASSEDGWKLKHIDYFTWGPRDVMIGYEQRDFLMSDGLLVRGYALEYDFSADMSNCYIWPDVNKYDVYFENKTLSDKQLLNPKYYEGSDTWSLEASYEYVYNYTPRVSTKVNQIEVNSDKVEVARYDSMGRKIDAPTDGVNIIIYSDGTSEKVFVK